ncbi:MAG: hypothetical protein ACTSYD_08775 [Candidatus Heimdallarchaeaceae archaeon]
MKVWKTFKSKIVSLLIKLGKSDDQETSSRKRRPEDAYPEGLRNAQQYSFHRIQQ